jgi:outer membrane protein
MPLRLISVCLFLFVVLVAQLGIAAPSDWREEKILPPQPDELGGFLGLADQSTADDDAFTTRLRELALGPFGLPEDPDTVYSIEAIEELYIRPAPDTNYASLNLKNVVTIALKENFDLVNAARTLASSSSSRRAAFAEFIPFIDLTAATTFTESRRNRLRRSERQAGEDPEDFTRDREVETSVGTYRGEVSQNLPWGGEVSVVAERDRTRTVQRLFPDQGPFDPDNFDPNDDPNRERSEEFDNSLTLRYDQPLLRGAGWLVGTAQLKRSRLNEMRQALSYRLNRRNVALNVIRLYYDVLRRLSDIEVSRLALFEVEKFLNETKIRYELKQIPESEINRAEIRFLQEKQRYVNRQQSFESSLDNLLTEMGLPLQTVMTLAPPDGQLVDLRLARIPKLDEGIQEALNNRLELLQEQIDLELQKITVREAKNDLLPDANVNAEWRGFEESSRASSDNELEARREVEYGASISVPLPNIGRRERLYRERLSLENAKKDQENQVRTIISEVKEAYRSLKTSETSTQILRKTVEQSRRSLTLENARFEAGLNTSTEVRNAQDDLFQALADYNQALLQMQVDISRVYRSLGREIY